MGRQSTRRRSTYNKSHNIVMPAPRVQHPKRSGKVNAPGRKTCGGMMQKKSTARVMA